jgi:hypothetical protein
MLDAGINDPGDPVPALPVNATETLITGVNVPTAPVEELPTMATVAEGESVPTEPVA